MLVYLDELKRHLRVDHDHEDWLIQIYAQAASDQVIAWLGRPVYSVPADLPALGAATYDPDQMVANGAIIASVLQLVADKYEIRSGSGDSESDADLPLSCRAMLAAYRRFGRPPTADSGQISTGGAG